MIKRKEFIMKKILPSLLTLLMLPAIVNAQTANDNIVRNVSIVSADELDDFDDIVEPAKTNVKTAVKTESKAALKPTTSKEAETYLQKPEIPDNIKQDYKEKDDGYFMEGIQLGVGINVLGGANAHIGYRIPRRDYNFWKNRFGFRVDYNSWKPLQSTVEDYLKDNPIEFDGNQFTGTINGTNYGFLVDFYPFGNTWALGNFRISGGYYTGDFSVDVSTTKSAHQSFSMKGITYTVDADAKLDAKLAADVKGPYAGIGFDFALLFGLKIFFDAGVVFIDNPKLTTTIEGNGTITACQGNSCGTPQPIDMENPTIKKLLEDTKTEYEDEIGEVTDAKIFPMVKVGLMLRF